VCCVCATTRENHRRRQHCHLLPPRRCRLRASATHAGATAHTALHCCDTLQTGHRCCSAAATPWSRCPLRFRCNVQKPRGTRRSSSAVASSVATQAAAAAAAALCILHPAALGYACGDLSTAAVAATAAAAAAAVAAASVRSQCRRRLRSAAVPPQ
jgi:hypothetical protein